MPEAEEVQQAQEQAANVVSVGVLARLFDLDPRRVQQLADRGICVRASHGKYELVGSVRGYITYLRGMGNAGEDLNEHRARLTRAKADIAVREEKRIAGLLIPRDQVERAWTAVLTVIRGALLSLPSRAAPGVADAGTIPEIQAILRVTCAEVLEELAEADIDYDSRSDGESEETAPRADLDDPNESDGTEAAP